MAELSQFVVYYRSTAPGCFKLQSRGSCAGHGGRTRSSVLAACRRREVPTARAVMAAEDAGHGGAATREAQEVLACLDPVHDPILGQVIAFHPFVLERPADDDHAEEQAAGLPVIELPERHARGEPEVCVPEAVWEARRQRSVGGADFHDYLPSRFQRRTMRSMDEFLADEMITSVEGLERLQRSLAPADTHKRSSLWARASLSLGGRRSSAPESATPPDSGLPMSSEERARVLFVCIEDAPLGARLLTNLGCIVGALAHLEVLILKGVGLLSIQSVSGTDRLMYLDISANRLTQIDELLRVVRECSSLLWADFEGNPCLAQDEAEAKLMAASSWTLRHLNKQPVEIRRKVGAVISHGDPSARSTLADQVWDAQVCSSHAVTSRRALEWSKLERLELPGAGLSVFHVGQLTALTVLDLSANQLSVLRGHGLEQLFHLRRLGLSHNLLEDPWELTPLLALASITWLAITPQRLPHDPLARSGDGMARFRRLVVLLTLDSVGSQQKAGLNYLDRPLLSRNAALDDDEITWTPVSTQERLDAIEEVVRHTLAGSDQGPVVSARYRVHDVWQHAEEAWRAVRSHVLSELVKKSVASSAFEAAALITDPPQPQHATPNPSHQPAAAHGEQEAPLSQEEESKRWSAMSLEPGDQQGESLMQRCLWSQRQRACLFASVGQHRGLHPESLARLTSLSLPDCDLTHVTLGDMSSLTALDLSRNVPLRFVEGLETQTRLETLLLHQTPLLCVANALPAIMSPMQHMRRLRVLTLPFHLLEAHGGQDALRRSEVDPRDAAAEADTAFSGGWQQLAEPLMLAVVGSCPLWWLNARRVSIADRLRAFEYMLRHQGAVEGQKKRGVQIVPTDAEWDEQLDDYLANLVLITSTSKQCICRFSGACLRRQQWAGSIARETSGQRTHTCHGTAGVSCNDNDEICGKVCQHHASRCVMPQDVLPGRSYDVRCVVELPDIHGFGLTSLSLSKGLPLFTNLRRLNLARNRLVTLCGLGLEGMSHLQVLDVSYNVVRDRLLDVAGVVDALPSLVALMLRGNPCMRTKAERFRLLQCIKSIRNVTCALRYLDAEISMDERVLAWAQTSARSLAELETLKQEALLVLCAPVGMAARDVTELDLSARRLRKLHDPLLTPYIALCRLFLQDNALSSLQSSGLDQLTTLVVLDLRRNQLTDPQEASRLVSVLSKLQELGLAGNRFGEPVRSREEQVPEDGGSDQETYLDDSEMRVLLLENVAPRYRTDAHYPLRFIDDHEIAISDIVTAAGCGHSEGAKSASKLVFEITVARQMRDCVGLQLLPEDACVQQLQHLDLTHRELAYVNFSQMPLLTRVILRHNKLDDAALDDSGLQYLKCLEHLDVSWNRLDSDTALGRLVAAGHGARCLTSLTLSNNPCFPSDNHAEHRVLFFSSALVIDSLARPGATLQLLNDMPIRLQERVEALARSLHARAAAEFEAPLQSRSIKLGWQQASQMQATAADQGKKEMVEEVRLTLLLEELQCSYSAPSLSMTQCDLGCLRALRGYIYLVTLDVRGNNLTGLEPLEDLVRLARLDVRDNRIPTADRGLRAMSKCDSLRHVCLQRMSCDWPAFAADCAEQLHHLRDCFREAGGAGAFFTRRVFQSLPALLDCDGELNPAPLAGFQWTAALHLKRVFGISANGMRHIDLTARNITKDDFYRIRDWLAFLPVTDLEIDRNPFCLNVQSYRYVLINDIRTLERLNGCAITDAERANAFKKVEEMKRDMSYNPPNVDSLKLDNVGRAHTKIFAGRGSAGSANAFSMWGSQLESWASFVQVQIFIGSFPDIPWQSLPLYRDVHAALAPLVRNLDYVLPDVQCICFWGYLKSVVLILTPIVAWRIFKLTVDFQRWEYEVVHKLRPALMRKLSYWALANVLSVAVALAIDCIDCSSLHHARESVASVTGLEVKNAPSRRGLTTRRAANASLAVLPDETCSKFEDTGQCLAWWRLVRLQKLPGPTIGWMLALVSTNTLVLLVWLGITLLARYKNRKGHNTGFWFDLSGMIKKCGMILISLSYLPICNIVLDNVRPFELAPNLAGEPGARKESLKWGFPTSGCVVTEGFANDECPDYPLEFERFLHPQYIMFWLSLLFAVVYMLGVPLYLAHHVREAVSVLDCQTLRHLRMCVCLHVCMYVCV